MKGKSYGREEERVRHTCSPALLPVKHTPAGREWGSNLDLCEHFVHDGIMVGPGASQFDPQLVWSLGSKVLL